MIKKIVSGGQTGADRAALDFALAHGLSHGGWCPSGRWAEDGPLAPRYQLAETPDANLIQRTEWNVRDSDATVIFSIGETPIGGSEKMVSFARAHGKPLLQLCRHRGRARATALLTSFLRTHKPEVLNLGGSRASEEPDVGDFTRDILDNWWNSRELK